MQEIDLNDEKVKLMMVSMASIGVLKTMNVAYKSLKAILKYFVLPRKDLVGRYGAQSWVVITGASDGLGKAYAKELAS
mgnify:CR=1 FL=1